MPTIILNKRNIYSGAIPIRKQKRINIVIKKGFAIINLNRRKEKCMSVVTVFAGSYLKLSVYDFHFLEFISDGGEIEYEFQSDFKK